MKLLSLEEVLIATQEAGVPGVEDLVAQTENMAEVAAAALAAHLNIKHRNTNMWDGKIYTTFLPSQPGQACPAVIDAGDRSGEWEGDGEEEEAQSMSMGG